MESSRPIAISNVGFVEEMFARFAADPSSVDADWRAYFEAFGEDGRPIKLGPSLRPPSIFNPTSFARAIELPVEPRRSIAPRAPLSPSEQAEAEGRIPALRSVPFFSELGRDDLLEVAKVARSQELRNGEVIVREGQMARDLFVIQAGTLALVRQGRRLAELGTGEIVGEMALLDTEPRSADVVAVGPATVLKIEGSQIFAVMDVRPAVARGILRVLTRRLRSGTAKQDLVDQVIRNYRILGHLEADIDPLGGPRTVHPELDPGFYGFTEEDMDAMFSSRTIAGTATLRLRHILAHLRKTYCRSIGVQFMHIDELEVRNWLMNRMETSQNTIALDRDQQVRILTKLIDAEMFEQFIARKFVGAKRFSLEGAESLIPLLDLAIDEAGAHGVEEVVIGMPHRGRLNVLANIFGKSPRQIFREFDDKDPELYLGKGDVKYHLGFSSDRVTPTGHKVHLSLTFNPSHLEFVGPVVLGRVRAKQDVRRDDTHDKVMAIVIHGDAAFAGQGVVQEMLNLSELPGYRTGGTLHVIVNNQIGFTTDPVEGRSTRYATDVARMLQIPVFHVNGEHPEAVAQALRLAMDFREAFQKDVIVDMLCYRKFGHNEGDEPAFTHPLLYKRIRERKSVREGYLENLFQLGGISPDQAEQIGVDRRKLLEEELSLARSSTYEPMKTSSGEGRWAEYVGGPESNSPDVDTGVAREALVDLIGKLSALPAGFTPHPKLEKLLFQTRAKIAKGEEPVDWATAESLAFASLLAEGTPVRLSGQDSGRGTFSHRHAILHDYETGRQHVPLGEIGPSAGHLFRVLNSPLTETAVLGFEYGYSLDRPEALVMWEAQFGDFVNVAQVIIDQFIMSGEDKWRRMNGLVLLLPHGFEGQGPEHSSARLERFLGGAAEDNVQIANFTNPAQLFHALRRQIRRSWRKPLVLMTPKSLLRHPRAVCSLEDLTRGTVKRVIVDPHPSPDSVRKVVFVSGKLYYELLEAKETQKKDDVALVRIEQFYPLAAEELERAVATFPKAEIVWAQEEPLNMGAFLFLERRFGAKFPGGKSWKVVSRPESASPATGSNAAHRQEQARLIDEALA